MFHIQVHFGLELKIRNGHGVLALANSAEDVPATVAEEKVAQVSLDVASLNLSSFWLPSLQYLQRRVGLASASQSAEMPQDVASRFCLSSPLGTKPSCSKYRHFREEAQADFPMLASAFPL